MFISSIETRAGAMKNEEAKQMIRAFASVGAKKFDITWTDIGGEKVNFRRGVRADTLENSIGSHVETAIVERQNIIVRPHTEGVSLVQLDDLNVNGIDRLRSVAFLTLETSPSNYQAWLAFPGKLGEDVARRLRKGAGADPSASGATRSAGSLNFKDKYTPDYPQVCIRHAYLGRTATYEQLQSLGLIASPETRRAVPVRVSPTSSSARQWPSYERCVEGAPERHGGGGKDISRADFTWCLTAIDWGWGIEETAARLLEVSPKARENGDAYAHVTARNAASANMRNRSR